MRSEQTTIGDSERWLSVLVGAMLGLSSLRRRDLGAGALFAATGAALMFRGITGRDGLFSAVGDTLKGEFASTVPQASADRREPDEFRDEVDESSMESFPASDPPAWTPTSGSEGEMGQQDVESDQGSPGETGVGEDRGGS